MKAAHAIEGAYNKQQFEYLSNGAFCAATCRLIC